VTHEQSGDVLPVSLPKDLAALESVLLETVGDYYRLLIIDPLAAAISADVDMHRDQDVRRPLARLARMAADYNICIATIRHVRKSHGGNAIYAGGGSVGISGQARVVMIVEQHPEDVTCAVLAVAKSNVGPIPPSLAFRKVPATVPTESGELAQTSRLEWVGHANLSADELLSSRDDVPGECRDATDWLRHMLAGQRLERKAVMDAARAAEFTDRTIDRTAKRIGVAKAREGFGAECRAYWSLPSHSTSAKTATPATPDSTAELAQVGECGGSGEIPPVQNDETDVGIL
jgi:hypothetical protein